MSTHATPVPTPRPPGWRGAPGSQLTSVSEAARRLLRGATPVAQPMISRAGLRSEAHRARLIMRAAIKDQQQSGS
jgi:hypothetical protein